MKTFVRREKAGQSEMGHESGQHDDNIFANAMAWTRGHDMDNEAQKLNSWWDDHKEKESGEIDEGWASQEISIGAYDDE
jgi:hypothetical protein